MASGDQRIILEEGVAVRLRRTGRARRMTLRVPHDGSGPVLTLPMRVPVAEGRAFAESRLDWLRVALARQPERPVAAPGVLLPVEGRELLLTQAPLRHPIIDGQALLIPRHLPAGPVVAAWLKQLALIRLRAASDRLSATLGRSYRAIVVRDTRSRWGSCTSDGRLMYSWRLAMAPPEVLEYVAAHEVSHLAHMDHSPRFWRQVGELMPDHAAHRAWLKVQGGALMRWRFAD